MNYIKIAKNFSRQYNLEFDECVGEAALAYCEAMHSFNADKGASFNTYSSTCVRNHLCNWVKKLRPVTMDIGFFVDVADGFPGPEAILFSKDGFQALSDSAKTVTDLFMTCADTKGEAKEILRAIGWSWPQIYGTFQELRNYVRSL